MLMVFSPWTLTLCSIQLVEPLMSAWASWASPNHCRSVGNGVKQLSDKLIKLSLALALTALAGGWRVITCICCGLVPLRQQVWLHVMTMTKGRCKRYWQAAVTSIVMRTVLEMFDRWTNHLIFSINRFNQSKQLNNRSRWFLSWHVWLLMTWELWVNRLFLHLEWTKGLDL